MTTEEANDLVRELWTFLECEAGRVPLEWVLAHQADVPRAWDAATDGLAMRCVLHFGGHPGAGPNPVYYPEELFCGPEPACFRVREGRRGSSRDCPACGDAVRRAVPTVSLAQLVEGARRAGADGAP